MCGHCIDTIMKQVQEYIYKIIWWALNQLYTTQIPVSSDF